MHKDDSMGINKNRIRSSCLIKWLAIMRSTIAGNRRLTWRLIAFTDTGTHRGARAQCPARLLLG